MTLYKILETIERTARNKREDLLRDFQRRAHPSGTNIHTLTEYTSSMAFWKGIDAIICDLKIAMTRGE